MSAGCCAVGLALFGCEPAESEPGATTTPTTSTSEPGSTTTTSPGVPAATTIPDPSTTDPAPTTQPPSPPTSQPEPTTTSTLPPLDPSEPEREWKFTELQGDDLIDNSLEHDSQVGGVLHRLKDYGPTFRDKPLRTPDGQLLPADGIATGEVFAAADGVTWWLGAEAPAGVASVADDPIGSHTLFIQEQMFTKLADDAELSFTVLSASIEVVDLNAVLGRECPEQNLYVDDIGEICDMMLGELVMSVSAWTPLVDDPTNPDCEFGCATKFFDAGGGAAMNGWADNWDARGWSSHGSEDLFWDLADFDLEFEDLDGIREGLVRLTFRDPITVPVDLSSIDVGDSFKLLTLASAEAYNRNAGPPSEFGTAVSAFLRDPLGLGGTSVSFTGLEPIANVDLGPLVERPERPAPCPTGTDSAAGDLQFSTDGYTVGEASSRPTITVTRTGGTRGAVTATIATTDGTATADEDYVPVSTSVFFADGDDAPRTLDVPIVRDLDSEGDETFLVTLSDPGGCASLGTPTTATVTIRDDDPPPAQPSGLDTTFGTAGKATTTAFGGDRSAMAVQPDGKIVMVGGTPTDFVVARFDEDGTLDTSFDADGMVTTDVGGGFAQEEALGVAVQPDGKIVVAGYTDRTDVAVVRYNTDGSLDNSFGTGGKVTSGVLGVAHDVVIQPDGKIVIAGSVPSDGPNDDFGDLLVARYLSDGRLDPSFGTGGQRSTDVGGLTNEAQNVVLQPDGAIVVSGSAPNPGSNGVGINHHTDLVRYMPDGNADPTFGSSGHTTLPDAFVGTDLALQPDGRLVLVGTIDTTAPPAPPGSVTEFAVVRLDDTGSPDPTFGTSGTAQVSVSALSSGTARRDAANAVAIQADRKIVVAGTTFGPNEDFAITRLDDDGSLDTDFAGAGAIVVDFFGLTDAAESVALQSDGKIVVSGLARDRVDGYGLARLIA